VRPTPPSPLDWQFGAAQQAINLRGLRDVLRALGRPDTPEELADERQALLACMLRRAKQKARGPAAVAAVLELAGHSWEAHAVRRHGSTRYGVGLLRQLAYAPRMAVALPPASQNAVSTGDSVLDARRARALRWAIHRLSPR
jgi:hypothetical protein